MQYKTIQITSVTLRGRNGRTIRISGIEDTTPYNFLLSVHSSTYDMITTLINKAGIDLPDEIDGGFLEDIVFPLLTGKTVTIGYRVENIPNYSLAKVYSLT